MAMDEHRRAEIRAWAIDHEDSTRPGAGPGMVLELLAEIDSLLGELDLTAEAMARYAIVMAELPPCPREFLESGEQTRHHAPTP